eukprot:Hpha_TRINITY_DN16782_c6_g3::TRINITY_DN16782_c6_g3_i1::g.76938::m.76938
MPRRTQRRTGGGHTTVAGAMEAIRQGQWETENRIYQSRAIKGDFTGDANKKLVDHFAHDRELLRLQISKDDILKGKRNGYFTSPLCFFPCFWPHQILCGMPISFLACTLPAVGKAVDAHRLILREKTLLYEVDPYPMAAAGASNQFMPYPVCFACECCRGQTMGFTMVIRLEKVDSIKVEPCQMEVCGCPIANDTLVVRAYGSHFPIAAIDAPANGEEFIRAVERQVDMCKSCPDQLPQDVAAVENMEFYGNAAGANPQIMMMQAMMGQGA